jgi:hypothetical protein
VIVDDINVGVVHHRGPCVSASSRQLCSCELKCCCHHHA